MKNTFVIVFTMAIFLHLLKLKASGDISNMPESEIGKKTRSGRETRQIQKAAVEAWGESLNPAEDYNSTKWITKKRSQPQYVFDYYVKRLSDLFLAKGAMVNFALVGACDGTNDVTIRERYLPNEHWRGLFVEPILLNVEDLRKYLTESKVMHRSHIIQAAATNECNRSTITVKTPSRDYMTDSKIPHWMRRQIGGIVAIRPDGKPRLPNGWRTEEVPCMRGSEILQKWAVEVNRHTMDKGKTNVTTDNSSNRVVKGRKKGLKGSAKRRPHVLKIDAEGFDYQVLSSFLQKFDTTNAELPLLVNYEAKSMNENYPKAVAELQNRGYIVSNYGNDGFALLQAQYMFRNKSNKKKSKAE